MSQRGSRTRTAGHVAGFWLGYLVILAVFGFLKGMMPPAFAPLIWGAASAVALLALTFWLMRREHRTAEDAGVHWSAGSLGRFAAGFMLGTVVYAAILLTISLVAGPLTITRASVAPAASAILLGVVTTFALALMEEVGFRGYPLMTLINSVGIWWAQLIVAIAFALTHILYGWSLGPVLLGVFPSALLFGAVAVATRGIACPLGVHVALNLCQGLMGEKEAASVWQIDASSASEPLVKAAAPTIGFAVVLLAAVAVTLWSRRRATHGPAVA